MLFKKVGLQNSYFQFFTPKYLLIATGAIASGAMPGLPPAVAAAAAAAAPQAAPQAEETTGFFESRHGPTIFYREVRQGGGGREGGEDDSTGHQFRPSLEEAVTGPRGKGRIFSRGSPLPTYCAP